MMFRLIMLMYVLVCWRKDADAKNTCAGSPKCPLFPGQNEGLVTLEDIRKKVESKLWVQIYYTDFIVKQSYGKCHAMWNPPDSEGNVRKQLMCYNFEKEFCEDFERTVKMDKDDCNRATESNTMNSTMYGAFYSQNMDEYLWYDSCYGYNEAKQCTTRYLDLFVKKKRAPESDGGKLDFYEFPWHLVVSDLKNHFDMDISDKRMKFAWKGPECDLDGKVITSSASRGGLNFIVVFIMLKHIM